MSDRAFFSICALLAIAMIGVALVWPQGLGARSPGRLAEPLAQPAPAKPSQVPSP